MKPRAVAAQTRIELLLTLRRSESLLVTLAIPLGILVFFSKVDAVTDLRAQPGRDAHQPPKNCQTAPPVHQRPTPISNSPFSVPHSPFVIALKERRTENGE